MSSSPLSRGKRVICFVDNTSTLGAVAKRRSPSQALNEICRKIAHVLLSSNITQIHHWILTSLNRSNEPSRRFENVALLILEHELRAISLVRRASIGASIFKSYTESVRNALAYMKALRLETDSAFQLYLAVADYVT